ncbi:glutathione synthase [Polaribacter sp. Z022]|uniref:glutathione synthase n=1 Tax=Polaribacter sp. Z022 TaxID=2927125 RepID=UPI0020221B22|nr:glutathione synthase [Polaribacter sp. Z022]MCL7754115.1 glutathione synthase [Polaribacter sp. Z022]
MNVCFLMYPWESIKSPENDTSLTLIHECVKRGHGVAICTPSNLTIRNSVTNAFCTILNRVDKISSNIKSFYKSTTTRVEMLPLAGFDVIFMRAEPPLDPLMLNFLDSVKDDVFIINSVQGLREANNKLYTAVFEDPNNEIIPVTHVSKNKDYLIQMIEESPSDKMILKPLNGFGGSGVILIEKSAMGNINSLLDFYISKSQGGSEYVILQEYIDGADKGDVRILILNGVPIGAMKRVPGDKDHRSNVSAGGTIEKHKLTAEEKKLCARIGPKLVKDGLYFVGIDVIGGKLVEVNVMSPGGITYMNKVYKTRIQEKVVNFMESKVLEKDAAFRRKSSFKKLVDEA